MAKKALLSPRAYAALIGCSALGATGLVTGAYSGAPLLWPGFLLNAFYFLTLALGAAVLVSIHHLANAGWSTAIRRIPEAMMAYLPFGALAMLAIFFGRYALYEWMRTPMVAASSALKFKAAYLTSPFFFVRMAVALALWTGLAAWLPRESRRQDGDGRLEHTERSKRFSAIFLLVFALTFMFASFDWIMSLEPEFYSTIFAVYIFSGLFVSGIAAMTIFVILFHRRGFFPMINEGHLHNLGKLVMAFSTCWAYIWLCQYLLIYYANLPEETMYYIRRTATPGWRAVFLLNIFLNWVIPFILLLTRRAKRHARWLLAACAIVLVGHWVDLYLMIFPVFSRSLRLDLSGVALLVGFGSLFLLTFIRSFERNSLIPMRDPYLEESLWSDPYEPPARDPAGSSASLT